jgi:hypothetical protein
LRRAARGGGGFIEASRDFKVLGAFFCNVSRASGECRERPTGKADSRLEVLQRA